LLGGIYTGGKEQDLNTGSDKASKIWNYGLRIGWAFHEYAELESFLAYTPTTTTVGDQNVYMYGVNAVGQYPITDQIVPYLTFGGGAVLFDHELQGEDSDFAVNYGGGLKFFAFKNLAIRPDIRGLTTFGGTHTALLGTLNLTYYAAFGPQATKDKDRDHDGLMDSVDQCPDEPETQNGYQDEDGCPDVLPAQDRDGDGIVDDQDKCPDEAETKNGFEDEDGCPDTAPAPTPAPVGDKDGDGILDNVDKCPEVPETKNGFEDEDGCPDHEIDQLEGVVEGIHFKTAQATIETSSYNVILRIAALLKKYKEVRIRVEGHTDSDGTIAFNEKLSRDRSRAVRDAIVEGGISPNRLEVDGYGESRPIATNATKSGKALNRRIEFKVLNPEVLRKE